MLFNTLPKCLLYIFHCTYDIFVKKAVCSAQMRLQSCFSLKKTKSKMLNVLSTTITINAYNAITSDIRKRYITIQKPTQEVNEDISLEESLYLLGSRPMRAPHLTKVV